MVRSQLGHRGKLRSIWSGWEPRFCPVLHLPGQQALSGKPSSSQSTPGQAGQPGVLRKLRFFYDSALVSAVHKQNNPVPRWSSTHVINTATWHLVKSLTWIRILHHVLLVLLCRPQVLHYRFPYVVRN